MRGRFRTLKTRGEVPSPGISATSTQIPTSPRKRGAVKAVPHAIALRTRKRLRLAYIGGTRPALEAGRAVDAVCSKD